MTVEPPDRAGPHYDPYPWLAPFYDATAFAMLLPFGGEGRLRDRVVELLDVGPGARVLELGCGTGAMTKRLLARGCAVTGLDLSSSMLARARRRAPAARLLLEDFTRFDEGPVFDGALLSFVVHELPPVVLMGALAAARRALRPDGALVVVDFGRSPFRVVRAGLELYLRVTEPAEARALVARGLPRTLARAGFVVEEERALALGTAHAVRARAVA